ncbi:NUDIX hydrolase [Uliginosibacterium sp. H1]|uniref:NUDIX hydrolase n=1 Tax=Uliginosibacterium sp. H1 TaxID=3114757 RepID=UPI002E18B2C2|nr:NUDIX domain-containing protein [Uliginosibacterium sp. H1]
MSATDSAPLDVLAWVSVHERRVLVVRTRGRDAWYLPGGKREPGESDAQGLAREVMEELGVRLQPGSLRHYCTVEDVSHGLAVTRQVRMQCFTAQAEGAPAPQAEIEALAWLSAAEVTACAPAARQVLARLAADGLID